MNAAHNSGLEATGLHLVAPGAPVLLVGTQKGGVGKSSLVANLAYMIAASGWKVLVIDPDQQGNLTEADLGVAGDHGSNLSTIMQFFSTDSPETRLQPISTGRENLDIIPGGFMLATVPAEMASTQGVHGMHRLASNLSAAIADVVTEYGYDMVLMDSGPGDTFLLEALLRVARYLVIPTAEDEGSLGGVRYMGARVMQAIEEGSEIELLGVVLFDVNPRATSRKADTVDRVRRLFNAATGEQDDESSVFAGAIRSAKGVAKDCRDLGKTAPELAMEGGGRWSRNAGDLATDYQDVAKAILSRM